MGKIINLAGPCNPADHYMLSAMVRPPEGRRLVGVHAFRGLACL